MVYVPDDAVIAVEVCCQEVFCPQLGDPSGQLHLPDILDDVHVDLPGPGQLARPPPCSGSVKQAQSYIGRFTPVFLHHACCMVRLSVKTAQEVCCSAAEVRPVLKGSAVADTQLTG